MTKYVYAKKQFVKLHETKPDDWPNVGSEGPKLSIGGYETSLSKYSLEAGFSTTGSFGLVPFFDNDTYDYAEFSLSGVTLTRPASYGQTATYTTETLGTPSLIQEGGKSYWNVVPHQTPYQVWSAVGLPDDALIPWSLDLGSLPAIFSPSTSGYGFQVSNVSYSLSTDFVGSMSFGDFTVATTDGLWDVMKRVGERAGLGNLATSIDNALVVKKSLENIVNNGLDVIQIGFERINDPTFSPEQFDQLVDEYFGGVQRNLDQALLDVTLFPGNPHAEELADRIISGVQLVGRVVESGAIPVSGSVAVGFELQVGDFVTIEGTITGSVQADIVLDGARSSRIDGGAGNDVLGGGFGADSLHGGMGHDVLVGGDGGDVLVGGSGRDLLYGGAGWDVAAFTGRRGQYTAISSGDGRIAVGQQGGADGLDLLRGVEQLQFADRGMHAPTAVDALEYIASYPDLMRAFGPTSQAAYTHYVGGGFNEGRSASFSGLEYIASYGDLVGTFGSDAHRAIEHYVLAGYAEARQARFDGLAYVASYADLVSAVGTDDDAGALHFISNGRNEGRTITFDADQYLANYQDLRTAFGSDTEAATAHYIISGLREGRTDMPGPAPNVNETIIGTSANDVLTGGLGRDVLIGGLGNDTLSGGEGYDTAKFSGRMFQYAFKRGADAVWTVQGLDGSDRLIGVEVLKFDNASIEFINGGTAARVTGSDEDRAESLEGTSGNDEIFGLGGADFYYAESGVDALYGGAGPDTLSPGPGQALFFGGPGEDRVLVPYGRAPHEFVLLRAPDSGKLLFGDITKANGLVTLDGVESISYWGTVVQVGSASDPLEYIASHVDLIRAFGADAGAGFNHYLSNGHKEGRGISFDGLEYIASYGDLIGAYGANDTAGATHYIQSGHGEARSSTFDGMQYIASHGDLIQAFGAVRDAGSTHYIGYGFGEGRATDTFDAVQYLTNYADLRAAFGSDTQAATVHYVTNGYFEGRTDEPT